MLRQLREDARDFPATMTLCVLWVVVLVMMVVSQVRSGPGLSPGQFILGLGGGHRFGDMTLRELFAGEVWRTVTATFVHYGLLHIGMNIYAMYHLGCLVESWYGPGQLVAIYVLTGGVGNLLSGLVRQALRSDPLVHSAGGSVVVMGLVGLCAVVGWRSRTRLGDYLRNQMVWVLALTAAIGLALPLFGMPIMDNWGHACGATVGALIGLTNGTLTRQIGRPAARWAGWLGGLVLAASAGAQVADNNAEASQRKRLAEQAGQRFVDDERRIVRLEQIRELYRVVALPNVVTIGRKERLVRLPKAKPTPGKTTRAPVPYDPDRELYANVVASSLRAFDSMRGFFESARSSSVTIDYRRVRQLLAQSLTDPPTFDELREVGDRLASLRDAVRSDREEARRSLSVLIESPSVVLTPGAQLPPGPTPPVITISPPGR